MPSKPTLKRAYLTAGRDNHRVHNDPMYLDAVQTARLVLSQIKPEENWSVEHVEIPNPHYKPTFPKPPKMVEKVEEPEITPEQQRFLDLMDELEAP